MTRDEIEWRMQECVLRGDQWGVMLYAEKLVWLRNPTTPGVPHKNMANTSSPYDQQYNQHNNAQYYINNNSSSAVDSLTSCNQNNEYTNMSNQNEYTNTNMSKKQQIDLFKYQHAPHPSSVQKTNPKKHNTTSNSKN